MRLRTALLAFLLSALAAPCAAAESPKCTEANARYLTVRDLLARPNDYIHVCVRLHAFLIGRGLLPELMSYYSDDPTVPEPRQVAVYATDDEDSGDRLWSARSMVDIVGLATTCETLSAESEAENERWNKEHPDEVVISMMSGLCHYRGGPAIVVSDTAWLANEPARLSGETARRRYGNLEQLGPRSSRLKSIRAAAERWFSAVQRQDFSTAFAQKQVWPEFLKKEITDRQHSPLRTLMNPEQAIEITYFTQSNWPKIEKSWRRSYACVCKAGNCTGQWPIVDGDATNRDEWPYFCLQFDSKNELIPY
jgi:hypothetical protein